MVHVNIKLEKQCPKVPNPFPAQGLHKYCLTSNLSGISPQVGKERHDIHVTLGYLQLLAQCLLFSVEHLQSYISYQYDLILNFHISDLLTMSFIKNKFPLDT